MLIVLLVEDDGLLRITLRRILENLGYMVIEAKDGMDGFAKSSEFNPDLIITDYKMPDMDGITMIRTIKKESPGTPSILISAHLADELKEQAISAGVDHLLHKPIDIEHFENIIFRTIKADGN